MRCTSLRPRKVSAGRTHGVRRRTLGRPPNRVPDMTRAGRILVVDDDVGVLTAARLLLKRHFAVVQTESDPAKLPNLLDAGFDVVLLDMNFARGADSGAEGLAWLA